jgi:FixJ family two-component response regulator
MNSGSPVIHIVDDDAPLRAALEGLLREMGYRVKTYASAGDFLLAAPHEAGCIILDLNMPGPSGLDLQDGLVRGGSTLPVIFLTGHGDISHSVRAMKAGAVDFLQKPVESEALLQAIETALAHGSARHAEAEQIKTQRARYASLTQRERDILAHVVLGRLNKQIASDLALSERTIKLGRASLMAKMQAKSLPELVRAAELLKAAGDILPPSRTPR